MPLARTPRASPPRGPSSRRLSLSANHDESSDDSESEETIGSTLRGFFDLEDEKLSGDEDPDADGTLDQVRRHSTSAILSIRKTDDVLSLSQRDHSRLKEAFMQMLSSRFINPRVLTVLPFYLETTFQDVQLGPTFRFFLPPPSGIPQQHQQQQQPESESAPASDDETSVDSCSTSTLVDSLVSVSAGSIGRREDWGSFDYRVHSGSLTSIRLAICKVIEVVRGCKEAIFEEYERLYRRERHVPNKRMDRDDFEALLYNWEWSVIFSPSFFFSGKKRARSD